MEFSAEISQILKRVEKEGDRAVEFYTKKYDKIELPAKKFLVQKNEWSKALKRLSPQFLSALKIAKNRIEQFHKQELKRINKDWRITLDSITLGQISNPIEKVGCYVPVGRSCYPSTVLMTAIPAKVAGVKKVVMVTPYKNLKDEILAAALYSGVDQIFSIGGPQAIAALAFGTKTIPKVDKIIGPGNRYVTEAKRQVFGVVGIEGLAGPSEIAIWADSSSNLFKISLNLLAQAEHDPDARSFLFTKDKNLIKKILNEIPKKFKNQIHLECLQSDQAIIKKINEIAPEHLYLAIHGPKLVLPFIKNAGAIFLGENSPVALGDYVAGPSHVLPTGRTARFNSALSVKDFLKWSSVIENRSSNNKKLFQAAKSLADAEGLNYHSLSLSILNYKRNI